MLRLSLLLFSLILIPLRNAAEGNDVYEAMRQTCPYSKFCTSDSVKSLPDTGSFRPCCLDCFCDKHCSAFGDCCPDHPKYENQTSEIECKSVHYVRGKIPEEPTFWGYFPSYRVIDFCSPEFNGSNDVVKRCNGIYDDVEWEDLLLVSEESGTTYKNKYCAFCHGLREKDIIRWKISIHGLDILDNHQLVASDAKRYIIETCIITSVWSNKTPRNARTLGCTNRTNCEFSEADDPQVLDICTNGPYMPFDYLDTWIRNAMCSLCTGNSVEGLCVGELTNNQRSNIESFEIILDTTPKLPNTKDAETSICRENEILDFQEQCRRVLCPPLHTVYFGECVPLSTDFEIIVEISIILSSNLDLCDANTHDLLNKVGLKRNILKYVQRHLNFTSCEIVQYSVFVLRVKDEAVPCLALFIDYKPNRSCSILKLGGYLQRVPEQMDIMTITPENTIRLFGQLTFLQLPQRIRYLLDENRIPAYKRPTLKRFFLCPFFVFNVSEYNDHVIKFLGAPVNDSKVGFSHSTISYKGFYPISKKEISVCMNTHMELMTGFSNIPHVPYFFCTITVIVYFM